MVSRVQYRAVHTMRNILASWVIVGIGYCVAGTEVIQNGGFEAGTTGWDHQGERGGAPHTVTIL